MPAAWGGNTVTATTLAWCYVDGQKVMICFDQFGDVKSIRLAREEQEQVTA